MNKFFLKFADDHFGELVDTLTEEEKKEFLLALLTIVLSHKHKKSDVVMPEGVDFDLVRDPMYKFSKKAYKKFFENSYMAFFVKWFCSTSKGKAFFDKKVVNTAKGSQDFVGKMNREMKQLEASANETLSGSA